MKQMEKIIRLFDKQKRYRKNRIIKYMACVIVIFVYFNYRYWDILSYISLPIIPLMPHHISKLNSLGIAIVWGVVILIETIINCQIKPVNDKQKKCYLNYLYVKKILDLVFAVVCLTYSVNMLINYTHKIMPSDNIAIYVSVGYLVLCLLDKEYWVNLNEYKNMKIEYTEYVDGNGKIIPVGAKVVYKGKLYKVEKLSTGEVKMNCRGMGSNTDEWLKLEDVIKESSVILFDGIHY